MAHALLNHSVRVVTLQFSFSSGKIIPEFVRPFARESLERRQERKGGSPSGTLVIEPTPNVSMAAFVHD